MVTDRRIQQSRSAAHYLDDSPASARLQRTVALVSRTLGFPIAVINILDATTQHTISRMGPGGLSMTPRELTLCDLVVKTGQLVQVSNVAEDELASHLPPARRDAGRYVGVPLTGRESFTIGTLCVMNPEPGSIDADVISRLTEFGRIVEDQLDLLRRLHDQRLNADVATAELATAIREEQIVPWYQAVVELTTGRLIGFEALARWPHPSGRMHDPGQFVPLAEDTDLIIELDLLMLRTATRQLSHWHRQHPDLRVGVNLSSQHFGLDDTATNITGTVLAQDVSPSSVNLEITETTRLDLTRAARVLGDLRENGFAVWLDDFGTGWSALDYLLRLPVTGIKIDRAVSIALGSRLGNALTRAVTGLATELDLITTIEGIETSHHAALAHEMGCTYGQGYFWAKPLPAHAVDERLAALGTP